MLVFCKQRHPGANLARGAVSALKTIMFDKCSLQWMKLVSLGETFDRNNLIAVMNHRQRQAAVNPSAIGEHGACATLAVIATFFGSGQPEVFTQKIKQRDTRIERNFAPLAIHLQCQSDSAARGLSCSFHQGCSSCSQWFG